MKWLRGFLSENEERKKLLWGLALLFVLALYVSGLLCQAAVDTAHVSFNPFRCYFTAIFSFRGWKTTICTIGLFLIFAGFIAYQGKAGGSDMDEERNFKYSSLGTYGTSGYMTEVEKKQVLREERDVKETKGIILGTDLISGSILSLPPESRLNRNIAVCGSQGSMKSRAFARNMILQCIRRGESMFITDPKSGAKRSCLKRVGTALR